MGRQWQRVVHWSRVPRLRILRHQHKYPPLGFRFAGDLFPSAMRSLNVNEREVRCLKASWTGVGASTAPHDSISHPVPSLMRGRLTFFVREQLITIFQQ